MTSTLRHFRHRSHKPAAGVAHADRGSGHLTEVPVHALRAATWRHPRLLLATKTAVAAGLAWTLVQPLGGFVDDYPYYAPLGATAAMSTSVISSVETTVRATVAIVTGGTIALVVEALSLPGPAGVAVGIGAGVAVGGLRLYGAMGSWVPFATLFVLILGGEDPWQYAAAYGGLVALGGLVGVVVNLAVPQLPLTPAAVAEDRLRERLGDQLDLLADGLVSEGPLAADDWEELRLALEQDARRVEDLVHAASQARRANWRARRWAEAANRRVARARALRRLTGCVDEVIALVTDVRTSVHAEDDAAARLRADVAAAFRAVATMLRTVEVSAQDQEPDQQSTGAARAAVAAVDRLSLAAGEAVVSSRGHYLAAAAIAVSLHQAVEAWA